MEAKDLKKKLQDYEYRTDELTQDVEQLKAEYQVCVKIITSQMILTIIIGAEERWRRKASSEWSPFKADRRRVQRGTNSSYECWERGQSAQAHCCCSGEAHSKLTGGQWFVEERRATTECIRYQAIATSKLSVIYFTWRTSTILIVHCIALLNSKSLSMNCTAKTKIWNPSWTDRLKPTFKCKRSACIDMQLYHTK